MEDGLVLVDDLPKGLVKLACVDVFGAVLEVAEESAGFGEGEAGAFRGSKLLLNPLPPAPEPGVILFRSVMLIEALRDLNQPAPITWGCVGFHGGNLAVGNSMGKIKFFWGAKKPSLLGKKGS